MSECMRSYIRLTLTFKYHIFISFSILVHRFYGNMDSVLEFSWRNIDPIKNRENQLVTWGKDSILTMWPIGAHLKLMCDPDDENSNQNPELPEQQNDGGGPSEGQHVLSSEPPVKNTDHLNAITGTVPIPASLSGVQGVVAVATAAEEERQKINGNFTLCNWNFKAL